jgi:hypothetical protein
MNSPDDYGNKKAALIINEIGEKLTAMHELAIGN